MSKAKELLGLVSVDEKLDSGEVKSKLEIMRKKFDADMASAWDKTIAPAIKKFRDLTK